MAFGHHPQPRSPFRTLDRNFVPRGIGLKTKVSDNVVRNPAKDSLRVDDVDTACETARGQTRLYFSGFSDGFIHGPDMLIPMVNLTEHLLETDERISLVREVQFRRLVRTELALTVKAADQVTPRETRKAAAFAKFSTNKKRTLVVLATPVPEKVEGGMWIGQPKWCENILANGGTILITDDEIEMVWNLADCPPFSTEGAVSTAVQLACTLELTMQTSVSIIENFITADRNVFAAGCNKLLIPDLTKVDRGSTISVTLRDPLRTGSNFRFAPFKMNLKDSQGQTLSEGIVELAIPKSREALINAHAADIAYTRMHP